MRICPFCGDNVVGNHTDCRMNQPTAEQHATEADIDAARDIIAEGRASHAGWAEHLKRCPGCEQCKTLGIDWGWEREQSWVERYDFLLGVIDSFAAQRQRHAEAVAENGDLRALLDEARSHHPEKYRSSSDDSGTRGAETGGELLPQPSSDWTRVAPSGEGSGQPTIREGWCPHCGTTRIEDYSDGVSDVCGHTSDANVVRLAFREGFNMSDGARAEHALTGKTITVDAAWAASDAKARLT